MAAICPFSVTMTCSRLPAHLQCQFDFTNNSTKDYYLSKRCTPLEGIYNRFLTVTFKDGTDVPYRGILAKRLPLTREEFVLVKAKDTVSATVELNSAYIFAKDGVYKFEYNRPLVYLTSTDMSCIERDADLPQGDFSDAVLASTEIKLVNTSDLEKPKFS